MKKFISILISLLFTSCILFCFSSCATKTSNDANAVVSESQTNDSQITPENNTELESEVENDDSISNTTDSTNETSSQVQSSTTQSQPASTTNEATHSHSYSNATCTSPKTCSCGATAGTALGHQFSSATCTSPQICERCGNTSGQELGHSYNDATCTSAKICTRCGNTAGSALGHEYVNNTCSRCGNVDPDSLPVGLNQLVVIDSSSNYKYDSGSFQDTYGNTYIGVHLFGHGSSGDSYAIYNLNQKYKTFSGSIVASPKLEDCAYADYYIYVDDVLAYSQTQQEKATSKNDFQINVTGATKLTIKVKTYFKPGVVGSGYLGQGSIVNTQLSK